MHVKQTSRLKKILYKKPNSIRYSKSVTFNAIHRTETKNREMILFDPHVKYAKSIGIEEIKMRPAFNKQLEKSNCNFVNPQEVLNAILYLTKKDKCMKCKSKKKNTACI